MRCPEIEKVMNEAAAEAGANALMSCGSPRLLALYFVIRLAQDSGNPGIAGVASRKYEVEMAAASQPAGIKPRETQAISPL